MQRFTYSPLGALRWRSDMGRYQDCARSFGVAAVDAQFEWLQQMVNVLMVAPNSLLGLVDTTLRMSHKDAMRYIQLRDDFRTAKAGGRTLREIFQQD